LIAGHHISSEKMSTSFENIKDTKGLKDYLVKHVTNG